MLPFKENQPYFTLIENRHAEQQQQKDVCSGFFAFQLQLSDFNSVL